MPVQLFYVTFGLFRASAFGLGAGTLSFSSFTFSLFRLFGAGFNLVKILVIGEVNDRNDRGADDQNREACAVERTRGDRRHGAARDVSDRSPEIVCLPCAEN